MGVAVLSPGNCLTDSFPHQNRRLISPPRSKPRRSPSTHKSSRRKPQFSPASSPPPSNTSGSGQIRILKRGEELTEAKPPVKDMKTQRDRSVDRVDRKSRVCSPEPCPIPLIGGFYAGSAFFTSPPPSSVPLPAFCTKNVLTAEDATFDLRRMLRLE